MGLSTSKRLIHRFGSLPALGLPVSLAARFYRGSCTALMYHRVRAAGSARPAFDPNGILAVDASAFDRQMRTLAEDWRPIGLDEAVRGLKEGTLPRRAVVVTFDDGYRDNFDVALPILEKHSVPATIYLSSGFMDRTAAPWWEELGWILSRADSIRAEWKGRVLERALSDDGARAAAFAALAAWLRPEPVEGRFQLMTQLRAAAMAYPLESELMGWDDVSRLARHPLITFGAHTANHPALRVETPEACEREILESRRAIEARIGRPVEHFAYPFGGRAEAGAREFALCGKLGFASSVTTRPGHWHRGHSAHLQELPRVMIDLGDDDESFSWKLSGLDSAWQARGRRLVTD
ncbi:MAG: polysaccharide deacetylase family protein [Bdellovibrionales bacterium]|nr:polysaccharide deacetylase family protein [Bdellovibrionales bacterium]